MQAAGLAALSSVKELTSHALRMHFCDVVHCHDPWWRTALRLTRRSSVQLPKVCSQPKMVNPPPNCILPSQPPAAATSMLQV